MAETFGASFTIDINNLKAGLNTANKLIRESQSEFKAAAAGLDDWTKSETGLTARINSLNTQIGIQREKVKALTASYQEEIKKGLDPASERAIYLRTQINKEQAALASNERELKKNQKALAELGDEAVETGKDIEKSGDGWAKFGNAAKAAASVALTAIAAIGAGVVALTKSAVANYAEYEQLIGGVETLFGAGGKSLEEYAKSVGKSVDEAKGDYDKLINAQSTMIENANNAYKTAGMSANEYMSNVTSFSASLISSLGGDTEKAAAAADRAMTDISDNANKMGSDMQSIVDTYQSLARGNYQMLDNLKLGYGGTKAEMERMIADANKVKKANGEMANLSIDSFADVTEAIHIIQTEMGITGTTAKEASSTISGSVGAMKAAWQNLLTGIADDTQDFDTLINNFVDSFSTAAENLLPRIAIALKGVVRLIEELVPHIPPILQELLPVVIDGIMNVVNGLVNAFPDIINTVLDVIPQLLNALIEMIPTIQSALYDIVIQIIDAIAEMLPDVVDAIIKIIPILIENFKAAFPKLLQAAINLIMAIVDAIPIIVDELMNELPTIIEVILTALTNAIPLLLNAATKLLITIVKAIPTIVAELLNQLPIIIDTLITTLINAIPLLLDTATQLLMAIVDAIPIIITALVESLPQIISSILTTLYNPETIQQILDGAIELLMAIVEAIPIIVTALVDALPVLIETITNTLMDPKNISQIIQGAVRLFTGIITAIPQISIAIYKQMPTIIKSIVDALIEGIPQMIKMGGQLIEGLWEGIKGAGKWLKEKIGGFFGGVVDGIADFFGIASPSKLMENLIGKNMALGISEGFTENMKKVNADIKRSLSSIESIDVGAVNDTIQKSLAKDISVNVNQTNSQEAKPKVVTINQYNTYSQEHSRYELYKSKQQTVAAVRLAMGSV